MSSSTFQINIISIISNFVLGAVFFVFTSSGSFYGGESCKDSSIRSWGKYACLYHWLGFILLLIFYFLVRKYEKPQTPKTVRFTTNLTIFLMFINLYMFLPFIIMAIALIVSSFDSAEHCGWLSLFGKIYSISSILFLCSKCGFTIYAQANMQNQINVKSRVRLLQKTPTKDEADLEF